MGLMYVFPAQENEIDRLTIKNVDGKQAITLKSYGLPMIFWGYLAAILIMMLFMFLAIKEPLFKMIEGMDQINQIIGILVLMLFILGPISLLAFFFYEKRLIKSQNQLKVAHLVFWIPLWQKSYQLKSPESFNVTHFMASPNIAKSKNDPKMRGFENKGHFELWSTLTDGTHIRIDRHSRKIDLIRMSELLSKY